MLMNDDLQLKNKNELIHLLAVTQEELAEKEDKIISFQEAILQLKEHIRSLTDKRFGKSSEKYIANEPQGRLFDEAMLPENIQEIEETEETITVPMHQRKKTGRKGLPKELPRERIEYDLTDD